MSTANQLVISDFSKKKSSIEVLLKYVAYLPWFILSVAVCIGLGVLYTRYAMPDYKSSTAMLVKTDANGGGGSRTSGGNDIIESAMMGGKRVNIDNEIELLKSKTLLRRVMKEHGFNVQYFNKGNIRTSAVYKTTPFVCQFTHISDSGQVVELQLSELSAAGGKYQMGGSEKTDPAPFTWSQPVSLNGTTFRIDPVGKRQSSPETYIVKWLPIAAAADQVSYGLKVASLSPKTTIITLTLDSDNPDRGADILNGIISTYQLQNIEDKSIISNNTISFINQRLDIVTRELSGVEENMQDYRNRNKIIDPQAQLTQLFASSTETDKTVLDNSIRLKLAGTLLQSITNSTTQLIPSNLGIEDASMSALFTRYNELQLKIDREAPLNAPNSLLIQDLKGQAEVLRNSIISSVRTYIAQLQEQNNEISRRNAQYQGFLNQVPARERTLKEISRQQSIQEGLYLYLLQKREETAITSASTTANYQQIDEAVGSWKPVSPNAGKIRMYSILLGLILPIGFIYLKDLLNDRVNSKTDITDKTKTPFLGEIGHWDQKQALVVTDNSRNILAEQFRIVRNNLQFIMRDQQVLMVTSSISGEGKSFISLNIAAVLAISGKRVALLEFDLRKPRITKNMGYETKPIGLSNYLAGNTDDLTKLYVAIDGYPSLHLFGAGPIPPNPGELMLNDRISKLFTELKRTYDYVIIDSAPVGLVGDSFSIGDYADAVMYVIRQRYTYKSQVDFVNDIYESKKLKNMGIIINDVKLGGRYGYYGYGYGYGESTYGAYFEGNHKPTLLKNPKAYLKQLFS